MTNITTAITEIKSKVAKCPTNWPPMMAQVSGLRGILYPPNNPVTITMAKEVLQ